MKARAVLGDDSTRGEAEYLIAAAVGEDGSIPSNELVEAAETGNQLIARAKEEVISIAENDLGAQPLDILMAQRLHRPLRADRHERGSLHDTVRGSQLAQASCAVGVPEFEREVLHRRATLLDPSGGQRLR